MRVLSDPESPLGGGVSALAVTEVQMRYSPARLKRPLLRNSDGGYREISWEEAEKLLLENSPQPRSRPSTTAWSAFPATKTAP